MARDDKDKDDDNSNFFIRFKNRVDANVSTGVKTIFGPASDSASPEVSDTKPPTNMADSQPVEPRTWTDFNSHLMFRSDYSPINLRGLPQPIPNDIEPGMDPKLFSFQDAFEDLLAVSQGHELPPIKMRYEQNKVLRFMYPHGEPLHVWRSRLRAQGLIEQHPQFVRQSRPVISPPPLDSQPPSTEGQLWEEALKVAMRISSALFDDEEGPEFRKKVNIILEELEKKAKDLTGEFEKQRRQPETEEDLSSAVQSKRAEDQHSPWESFVKSLEKSRDEEWREFRKFASRDPEPKTSQVVSTEEHVDRFGFRHTTTTAKIFDEEGNQIGTSKSVSIRSVDDEVGKSEPKLQPENEASGDGEPKRPRKIAAWFWKKD